MPDDPLAALVARPLVVDAVERSREACTGLRWHPAMRRRIPEVRAEVCVRAAAASAELEGVRLPLAQVRLLVAPGAPADPRAGVVADPGTAPGADLQADLRADPVTVLVRGALRASLDAHPLAAVLRRSPAQALARLHTLVAADLLADGRAGLGGSTVGRAHGGGPGGGSGADPAATAGRPQPRAAARVAALLRLLQAGSSTPGLVLAALADAECTVTEAFPPVPGVLARALARTVVVATGLDPHGVVLMERHALLDRAGRDAALAGYRSGDPDGVEAWVAWWGRAVVAGAEHGARAADEVMAGRLA